MKIGGMRKEKAIRRMSKMQKKIWIKLSLLVVMILFLILISFPFFHPITVQGKFVPYEYTIHGTYIEINRYIGTEERVKIPSYLWFRPVREISYRYTKGAFELDYVTYVEMPNTVTTLSGSPFIRCWNLEEVILSENIQVISHHSFGGCEKLKKVVLSKNVREIVGNVFVGCTSLERVIFYNPETQIDKEVFADAFSSCNFDILTLVSAKDSAVEKYAKEHGIKWEELEE